jgi:hypothetical protein
MMVETVKALAQFAEWALFTGPFEGCGLGGDEIQDEAARLGLIVSNP